MTPSADRVRAYRVRQKSKGLPDVTRVFRKEHKFHAAISKRHYQKPFCGCDGEGCGKDVLGRQLYMLFRMGERELYTGRPLGTYELLTFITEHPDDSILVGFVFNYDVTMILRDLPPQQQKRLFIPLQFGEGRSRYVWFKDFDIEYLPRQYLRVRRVKVTRLPDGRELRTAIKGSGRTIYETFGFFQKSFLRAIEEFKVGSIDDWKMIDVNKAKRSEFLTIDDEIRAYCSLECRLLGDLMEKLRGFCLGAGIVPRTWNGAGKLATALHDGHGTITRKIVEQNVSRETLEMANAAYYGGRFEITRTGHIEGAVYEYDINSAYPAAMPTLPCLNHGRWKEEDPRTFRGSDGIYVASVSFKCDAVEAGIGQLGGLPIRSPEGSLYWPRRGAGVYWSCEIESARRLGFDIKFRKAFSYEPQCSCSQFAWVKELYDYRRSIGKSGPGYPIKLGINSLYGKLAQRIGQPKYANPIWAGLITAQTRSKLNVAISHDPSNIVMLATDGVYSLSPLPLDCADSLGAWESHSFDGMFIVQPGLYWSADKSKRKSRGLSGSFFERPGLVEKFEDAFRTWEACDRTALPSYFPEVPIEITNFVGMRLANARGKPETAGVWKQELRTMSFDYRAKRQSHEWRDGHIVTSIKPGYAGLVSTTHKSVVDSGGYEPLDELRRLLEEGQDYVDTGPPWKNEI
jgi:DNA polymerase type B, organellar and viral